MTCGKQPLGARQVNASHPDQAAKRARAGLFYGLAAYGLWGVMPIYFKWLQAVPSIDIAQALFIGDGALGYGPFSLVMDQFTPPLKGVPEGF